MSPIAWISRFLASINLTRSGPAFSTKKDRELRTRVEQDPEIVQLCDEVKAIIKRYKQDDAAKPPFSMAEIVVMAAILGDDQHVGIVDACTLVTAIRENFRYYSNMDLECLWHGVDSATCDIGTHTLECHIKWSKQRLVERRRIEERLTVEETEAMIDEVDHLVEERDTLYLFDLPLVRLDEKYPDRALRWACGAGPMRTYLRNALDPQSRQVFRIMDLPTELRLEIFEHVLRYHSSGLGFRGSGERLQVLRKISGLPDMRERSTWLMFGGRLVRDSHLTGRPNDMLALLLVNRQFFAEAMPMFYKLNHFHAHSAERLIRLLRGCGERRRKYFTSISFNCCVRYDAGKSERAFELLATVPGLRYLGIDFRNQDWLTVVCNTWWHSPADHLASCQPRLVSEVPALIALSQCTTREVEFGGGSPVIEKFIEERIVKRLSNWEIAERRAVFEKGEKAVVKRDRKAKRVRAKENRRLAKECADR